MAVATRMEPRRVAPPPVDVQTKKLVPVKWWAGLGALVLVFEVYVLTRWVSGPLFKRVPTGPSDPPTFMKVAIVLFEAVSIPAALGLLYFYVVRPWRRERHVGADGLLVIAFATLWFQDPLSAYSGPWFTYNSWATNFGSWVNSIPGALAPAEPGKMVLEPILMIPGIYVWVFVLTMLLGSWLMRRTKARWPEMSNAGVAAVCFAAMFAFDVVFEGVVFMPLGIWEYPGGHFSIFPSTYHKFPLIEMFTAGGLFAAVACLRFFKNDRGETLAERGIEEIRVSSRGRLALRALATIGAVHLLMIVFYNLPNSWSATHSTPWPADLQKRSYLTDFVCGEGTDRACPGPAIPQSRNDNSDPEASSAHVSPTGTLVVPKRTSLPALVPFDRGKPGP